MQTNTTKVSDKLFTIIDLSDNSNYEKRELPGGIVFFSDEWNLKRHQCQNIINCNNGVFNEKIYGRKCVVKQISSIIGKEFLETNHLQGSNNLTIIFFGLFYSDRLVSLMSLGRHSRQISQNRIVLDRYCVENGIQIIGGASKLFKSCIEWAKKHKYDEIISFSDNRFSEGKIYKTLGFELEKNYKSDYFYVDIANPVKKISKQSQKKVSSKCPIDLTELEWAEKRGLKRLWDNGKKRWTYRLTNKPSWKEQLSLKCAIQNQQGDFKQNHIRGYFKTTKNNNGEVYYGSSYELRYLYLVNKIENIKEITRGDIFKDSQGKSRNPDFKITHEDGTIEIVEIKPEKRCKEEKTQIQINETIKYADKNNYKFSLWTEKESQLSGEREIISWAKKIILETTGNADWIIKQKEISKKSTRKHYENKIKNNKIEVYCGFCKTHHKILKLSYNINIKKNGKYIYIKENGHIIGKRSPKTTAV